MNETRRLPVSLMNEEEEEAPEVKLYVTNWPIQTEIDLVWLWVGHCVIYNRCWRRNPSSSSLKSGPWASVTNHVSVIGRSDGWWMHHPLRRVDSFIHSWLDPLMGFFGQFIQSFRHHHEIIGNMKENWNFSVRLPSGFDMIVGGYFQLEGKCCNADVGHVTKRRQLSTATTISSDAGNDF